MNRRLVLVADCLTVVAVGLACFISCLDSGLHAPRESLLVLDRAGRYMGEVPAADGEIGYWALPVRLPEKILAATLETEDRHYFDHGGVHLPSVLRALWQDLAACRIISGASTIAMQVARMQNPGSRGLVRKIKEAAEAELLISKHGHDRVLRHYLTIAPYGNRIHGIVRAARYYFDKPTQDLSWLQAAFLAGLPQAPGRMDPHKPAGLWRARKRARHILKTLRARGRIDERELTQELGSDLQLVQKPQRSDDALHAVLRVCRMARSRSGPILRSTIDLGMQSEVAWILRQNLSGLRERGAGNTAAMVVDSVSGEVLAYMGSADYFDDEHRGAIDYGSTKRPPGSALKPFVYGLALAAGNYTAASELPDIRVEFDRQGGRVYLPRNITHNYLGPMLFREALANSRNIPALRVQAAVGVDNTLDFFRRAGVAAISMDPDRYGLGLVLGNLQVTLEELVGLYGILANDGRTLDLRWFVDDEPQSTRRLLPPGVAQLITNILSDPLARMPSFPRGNALEFDYALAAKTGTSQGYRDAWALGFSDRLLVGVWLGNHDWRRMNHLGGLYGAGGAMHSIMNRVMQHYRPYRTLLAGFPPPAGYLSRTICPLSGKLATANCPRRLLEYFAPGSEPYKECPYHQRVKIDKRNGLLAGSGQARCPRAFVKQMVMLSLPECYEPWARAQHIELAPRQWSPLCGLSAAARADEGPPKVAIEEPRNNARYLWDPDTPAEFSTLRLAASVRPRGEEIVWLVDGVPVAKVGYPYEFRWSLVKGRHVIEATMVRRPIFSKPITVTVVD